MTRKEKLKLIKELEQRVGNLRAHIFYGYSLNGQGDNVREIKKLVTKLNDVLLTEEISKPNDRE